MVTVIVGVVEIVGGAFLVVLGIQALFSNK